MPKGYWIASVEVSDAEIYKGYAADAPAALAKFGGIILARGGDHEVLEGEGRTRNVVVEFPSLSAARDCFNSPEYQAAREKRQGAGVATIVIVEGVG